MVCSNCNCILHKKCKSGNIDVFRNATYCKICTGANDIIRYNPFYQSPHFEMNELSQAEPIEYIESIQAMSSILENCKSFTIDQFNRSSIGSKDSFSTYFLNIDGNATNFDNFAVQMSTFQHKFSIIGLAETNTNPENKDLFPLDNYSSCYQNRYLKDQDSDFKSKGSGVCLYVHNSFNYCQDNKLSICKKSIETLFVTLTNTPEPIKVGVIYRPPNSCLEEFNQEYELILTELSGKKAYILGDFNINLLQENSTPLEDRYQEITFSCGFTPTISIPTHHMPHCIKTCIDNIHSNDIDQIGTTGVIVDKFSHHNPVFVISKLKNSTQTQQASQPKKVTIHYDYSNSNLNKLCEIIEHDLDKFLHNCESFDSFLELFQEKIDESCKLLTPRTTKRNSVTNPWITQGLINSIEKKARLYFEWRDTCTLESPEGDLTKLTHYKEYKQFLKNAIKRAKLSYYLNKFEETTNNSKKTWKIINELRGKVQSQSKDDFVINGQRVTSRRIIANKFNEYFTSLASKLNENLFSENAVHVENFESFTQFMSKSVASSIYLEDTNPEEIMQIISDFSNGKASDIPIIVVKRTANLLALPLAKLYNGCLRDGIFPSIFKIGKVTPIYKKDNKECIENYRPVSILPIFGKIFEKIIYKRLYNFFMAKGVLHEDQFGFRKGHSTAHALHKSVNSIKTNLENGKHVLGIFIDLSKAFDTLDHGILLSKLEKYGIRGSAHALMVSYLTDRKQYVSFNKTSSDSLSVRYGVPQGSILGPLLFLLYMNDITNSFIDPDTRFVLYADDTNIFVAGPSMEATYLKANRVLECVSKFMKCNLLHINMSKCCYVHFRPTSESDETCARVRPFADENDKSRSIFIDETKLLKVCSTKFLGIIIDEDLNWGPHIKHLKKKLRSITGAICRIRKSMPPDLYLKVYTSLVESHLTYGITVWGGSISNQANDKLFIIQKQCVRILFGDLDAYLEKQSTCARARPYKQQKLGTNFYKKEHTKPIFNRLKILTVQGLFKYHCTNEFFKIIKFRSPYPLYEEISISQRNSSNVAILPSKSNTFLYIAAHIWNQIHKRALSSDKGIFTSVNSVKLRTKAILLEAQSLGTEDQWIPHNFEIPNHSITSQKHTLHNDEIFVSVV